MAASWLPSLSLSARDYVARVALEALGKDESGRVIGAALDYLVLLFSDASSSFQQYSDSLPGLFQSLFAVLNACEALSTRKKAMELLALLVDKSVSQLPHLTSSIITCLSQVWQHSFTSHDEDAQLKVATLTALIQVFRVRTTQRYTVPEELLASVLSVVAYSLDPTQAEGLHLRDVRDR